MNENNIYILGIIIIFGTLFFSYILEKSKIIEDNLNRYLDKEKESLELADYFLVEINEDLKIDDNYYLVDKAVFVLDSIISKTKNKKILLSIGESTELEKLVVISDYCKKNNIKLVFATDDSN